MPERLRARLPLSVAALLVAAVAGCAVGVPPASVLPETTPTPSPSASVTPEASPSPRPTPVPEPTPSPDPGLLDLRATGCHGGVLLDWSPAIHPDFHHYTALRSPEREIARDYPPLEPAVDWGDSYTTDRFVTTAVDASILPSDTRWYYRVMAYDARGRAVAASQVRAAELRETAGLGSLEAGAGPDGVVRLSWRTYGGPARCFSAYRILAGSGGGTLSTLTVVSNRPTGSIETDALRSGVTYQLRVEAVRTTTLGSFVLGETDTVTFTVP